MEFKHFNHINHLLNLNYLNHSEKIHQKVKRKLKNEDTLRHLLVLEEIFKKDIGDINRHQTLGKILMKGDIKLLMVS